MEDDYKFGANILENLTTGMYRDSRTIYREYIQNACDSIDNAIREGILSPEEAEIRIEIYAGKIRKIVIEDNGMGIPADKFRSTLGNIADSDKKIGDARGFRGIGRLCGLAYCEEVLFIAKYKGEEKESVLRCRSSEMRRMLNENTHGIKYSAVDVLRKINEFFDRQAEDPAQHFFRVELINVNDENHDLLNIEDIKNYLSFVAPVAYDPDFKLRTNIKKYAKSIKYKIDEYKITVNQQPIFKQYTTDFKTKLDSDEITDIECREFRHGNGNLIAWIWWGMSNFKGVIDKKYRMRGIRLRVGNIQIGDEYVFKDLFKEDRGTTYFIGEVFAVSPELIPNSQRDYLNENKTRNAFEAWLRSVFSSELNEIYRKSSQIRSAKRVIDEKQQAEHDFEIKKASGYFKDESHMLEAQAKLKSKRENAEKAVKKLERLAQTSNPAVQKIYRNVEDEIVQQTEISEPVQEVQYRKDKFSNLNDDEQKIIERVLNAVQSKLGDQIYSQVADVIDEEFEE